MQPDPERRRAPPRFVTAIRTTSAVGLHRELLHRPIGIGPVADLERDPRPLRPGRLDPPRPLPPRAMHVQPFRRIVRLEAQTPPSNAKALPAIRLA